MGVRRVAAKTRRVAQTELFQQQADTKGSVPGPQLSREGLGSRESGRPAVAERQHLSTKEAAEDTTLGAISAGETPRRTVDLLTCSTSPRRTPLFLGPSPRSIRARPCPPAALACGSLNPPCPRPLTTGPLHTRFPLLQGSLLPSPSCRPLSLDADVIRCQIEPSFPAFPDS